MSPNDTTEARLRDALAEVADSTHLSPDAWARVEQRARRRRVPRAVIAVAATLGVAAIATGAVLLAERDDHGPEIAANGDQRSACGVAPRADLIVTLDPAATTTEIGAVERLLAEQPEVVDYAFQAQEEGVRIFQCVYADEPEVLSRVDLTQMPPVFLVRVASGTDLAPLIREVEAAADVVADPGTCSELADVEVYMTVDATAEQIAAARTAIEQSADVAEVVFVSKESAYSESACRLVAQPELLAATTPDALPSSFRVTLGPGAELAELRRLLQLVEGLEGVQTAVDTRYEVVEPLPGYDSDDIPTPPDRYAEVARGVDPVTGSPWRLSVLIAGGGAYSASAAYPSGEVFLDGVETEDGGVTEGLATSGSLNIVSLPSEVTRVDIVLVGRTETTETVPATSVGLRTRFLVARLPAGETTTLIARNAAGDELYRIQTIDGDWTTQP